MQITGLLLAIFLLMYLTYRGFHLFPTSIFAGFIVIITNGIGIWEGLSVNYANSFAAFVINYGFVLLFGAIFGQIMAETGCAKSISYKIIKTLGTKHILLVTILVTSLLAFGGLATFVIVFTVYPITKVLFEKVKLPQTLNCAAMGLGAGTYTMTALPFSPSVQNIIPTKILGTDVAAAPLMGIVVTIFLFTCGYMYLNKRLKNIVASNPEAQIALSGNVEIDLNDEKIPDWKLSLLPIIIVIGTLILTKKLMVPSAGVVLGLVLGSICTLLVSFKKDLGLAKMLATGSNNGGNAIICASAVIGFAGVVKSVPGFQNFIDMILNMNMNPYVTEAIGVNLIAGIVGSATGGVQIFLEVLGSHFLEMGLNPEAIHRVATIASGGLDSLPHCSSVVIMLSAMGLTHKEAYKDFGVITVVIPLFATVIAVIMAITLY
ncbi:GntP family permease [Sedimentibacter sp. B4]|uniref:GntP family permease n=1 Tax=Sedimentibacter sp. B4 TaxID=304766 RepID=UPI0002E5F1DF|nr:GntP family permease [Sedimentibacter sp. B4]